jgi:zinc protease
MSLKRVSVCLTLAALAFSPGSVSGAAQAQIAVPSSAARLEFPLVQYTLRNGLHVILSEDDSLPLVSVVVAYGTGPLREPLGKSGLAYLMENLMFQGSENVSPMQHINHIQRIGGEFNANTTFDKTYFYQTLPSNQLALALWLESDRMASLNINTSNVEQAKEALLAEHRQRRATEPYMESFFRFDQMLYPDYAYGHPLLGTDEDIKTITEEDVRAFYTTFYIPNNAVLCVSGAIDIPKAKELIVRYFETIPRGGDVPDPPAPAPGASVEGADVRMKSSLVPTPALHIGYRIGRLQAPERYSLKILDILMFRGKSSRLYKRLVKKERIALYLSGGVEERRGPAAFKIFLMSNNPVMLDLCRKAIVSEIGKLRTNLVSEAELAKAKALFKMDYLNRLSTSLQRALFLCETRLSGEDPENLLREFSRYLGVTPMSIVGTVNRIFKPDNALILQLETK